jgi:hypothetical protein
VGVRPWCATSLHRDGLLPNGAHVHSLRRLVGRPQEPFVTGIFAIQRRRRPWLALLVVAALPGLRTVNDLKAGLATFLAVGITMQDS